jgi:O-antigen ligase
VDVRRPRCLELGLFLVVLAVPLAFTPFSDSPFADPKILLLVLGTLLVWLGGVPVDRRLAIAATAWVTVTAVASLIGVDPAAGILASTTGGGGGVVFTACCAVLLVCGAGLPQALTARARGWLVWAGLAISVLLLVYRLAPHVLERAVPGLSLIGSTMGNQLFAGALVAAAMAAAAAGDASTPRRLALLVVMTAAVASIGERSSLVLPVVALVVTWRRAREPLRRAAVTAVVVVATFALWQLAQPLLPGAPPPQSTIQQLRSSATDTGRFTVWRVTARAWLDRPVLGWGPGTTLAAYLRTGTAAEVESAERGWPDAHDLFLETGVSTGIAGVLALLALVWLAAARAIRSSPEEAWAVGVAATLAAYSLVEPLNLVLTPLLFLTAGIAAGAARRRTVATRSADRGGRALGALVTTVLVAGLVLAALAFAAAILEQQGTQYGEPEALRTALRLQPWRSTARQELAIQLAVAGRSGDAAAGREAKALMSEGIDDRPWDPDARIAAARVDTLLNDPAGARVWLEQQLERFPGDLTLVSHTVNAPPQAQT